MKNFATLTRSILAACALLLAVAPAKAQYVAITNGMYSNPGTWKNNLVPPANITGTLTIGMGIAVTMDKDLTFSSGSVIAIDGTLSGNYGFAIHSGSFTMGINAIVNVDSIYFDNSVNGTFSINNSLSVDKFVSHGGSITGMQGSFITQELFLEADTLRFSVNASISPSGRIYFKGGYYSFQAGAMFSLTNPYSVQYLDKTNFTTGDELSGPNLFNLLVDIGNGNEVKLGNTLNLQNGNLYLKTGDLNLNNNNLTISSNGDIDPASTGVIKSTSTSDININKSIAMVGALTFPAGANSVRNLSISITDPVPLKLGSDVKVTGQLDLQNGKVDVKNHKLSLITGATMTGDTARYVIVTGGGALVSDIAPGKSFTFHVGTAKDYAGCTVISPNSTAFNGFNVSLMEGVKNQGATGKDISASQPLVGVTWLFQHTPSTGLDYNLELMWKAGLEKNSFDRQKCYITQIAGATWDKDSPSAAKDTSGMYLISRKGLTNTSAVAIFDANTVDVQNLATQPGDNIKVYPNPASDVLYVQNTNGPATATMYSTTGKVVLHTVINNKAINISTLPAGTYYLNVSTGGYTHKAIIVKR